MADLPNSFIRNFYDINPGYRQGQNEELDALFNPSIHAEPLHIPMSGQIRKRLNTEMEYFWAFDRNGQNPYHDRVEQLRSVGFDYATTRDVQMAVESTVQGKDTNGFSSEIRNGDRRLMKVPKRRWLEIRKDQQLRAIFMANPRGRVMGEDGTVMGINNALPGIKTQVIEDHGGPATLGAEIMRTAAGMKGSVVQGDAATEIAEGLVSSNASSVSKHSVNKGA